MNRIYRSVWNEISRTFVAAAETVRGRGKPSSSCADAAPAARRPVLARRRPMMLALEQRFMFDGAAAAPVAEAAAAAAAAEAHAAIQDAPAPVEVRAAEPAKDGGKKEVVFVDTSVADYKTLEAGIRDGVAIVEIDGSKEGLAQIAQWAQTNSGYDSIAILGHGSQATLNLGTTTLTTTSLASSVVQTELATIGGSLTADGDLMLYGCDVAKGTDGEKFIADLAKATGADVAASTDATGSESKGGDWVLEKETGQIDAPAMLNDSGLAGFSGLLATVNFVEGSTEDRNIEIGATSFTRGIDGATFIFANGSSAYAASYFDIQTMSGIPGDGFAGVYALSARNSGGGVDFTITVQNGYTFDLTGFAASASTGLILVYYNGMAGSKDFNLGGIDTERNLSSLTDFNDVTSVTFTSENYALFQGLIITDVKAPPTLSTPGTIIYTDTAAANTFSNQGATLTAAISAVTNSPIASYGISGGTSGGSTDISGRLYDVSQAGTYGTLYVKSSDGSYVYVPNATAINASSSAQSETFTVTATDNAAATSTATLLISINGANDTPAITSGATESVAENTAGTVYTAAASDRDAGQTLSYSLGGTDARLFNINSSTGAVSFKVAPNYEVPSDAGGDNVYDITVTASDSGTGNLAASKAVRITVTDADEAPVFSSAATGSVAENGAAGEVVYTAAAADPEHGALTYSMSGTDAAAFTIDGTTGELKIKAAADYETKSSYSIRIEASDGNLVGTKDVTIAVSDVNDKPVITVSPQATQNVDQGQPTPITGISVADVDAGNDPIPVDLSASAGTFTATSGSGVEVRDSGTDRIMLNGSLAKINEFIAAGNIRYTSAAGATGNVTVSIGVDDLRLNGSADTQTLTLKIIVPNAAPLLTSGTPALTTITEKDTGNEGQSVESFVGASISDANVDALKGIAITALASGNGVWQYRTDAGAAWTAVGAVSDGSALLLRASDTIRFVPNGVAGTAASITYRAWDQTSGTPGDKVSTTANGGETAFSTATDTASIAVSDVNDAPTAVAISNATVSTFDSANAVVGTLSATDADNTSWDYTIVSVDGNVGGSNFNLFSISGSTLVATMPSSLTPTTHRVVVRATDVGGLYFDQELTVKADNAVVVTTATDESYTSGATYAQLRGGAGISLAEAIGFANEHTGVTTIRLAAGMGTLTSSGLTIDRDITLDTDALKTLTIEGNFIIASGKTLTLSNGAGDTLTLLNSIEGYGTLAKAGRGTLTLSAPSEYGGTRVDGGTLAVASSSALGSGGISLADGTTLAVSGTMTLANEITLVDGSATIDTGAGATLTLKGNSIKGSGGFIKAGAGTLDIQEYNLSSGTIRVNAGTLSIANGDYLGSAAISLADRTTLAVGGTTTLGNAITLAGSATIDSGAATVTLEGGIGGTGDLVKTGAGTLKLSGSNSYTGETRVNAGSLSIANNAKLGTGRVSLANGTTLVAYHNATINNAVELTGSVTLDTPAELTLSGIVSGTGSLVKTGLHALTLSGTNSYDGTTTVSGGELTISRDANLGSGSVSLTNNTSLMVREEATIDNAIELAAGNVTIGNNKTLTLTGTISGSGTLVKQYSSTLTLAGVNNSYTGETVVVKGTLAIAENAKLGSGTVTLYDNVTLVVRGTTTIDNEIVLNNDTTIVADAATTLSGSVSGSGRTLTKAGAGTLTLSGDIYVGKLAVSAGTLATGQEYTIESVGVEIGTGATFTLGGDTKLGALSGNGSVALGSNKLIVGVDGSSTTFSGTISGSGGFSKTGTGTLTLTGNNSYTGITTVNGGGTLVLAGGAALADSSRVAILGGTTLIVNDSETIGALSGSGSVLLGSSTLTVGGSESTVFSGVISGSGALAKTGSQTLTLSGANTYTGGTTLGAGELIIGSDSAIGSGTLSINSAWLSISAPITLANAIVINGALSITSPAAVALSGDISGAGGLIKTGSGTLTLSGRNTFNNGARLQEGTLALSGGAALADSCYLVVVAGTQLCLNDSETLGALDGGGAVTLGANTLTLSRAGGNAAVFSGAIEGDGALVKAGGGTQVLSGDNTFTGGLTIDGGELQLTGGAALADSTAVCVNANGRLQLFANETIGTLTGAGTVALGANTLTVSETSDTSFSGAITGTGGLTKSGVGTLTLVGTNSYTGATTVNAGTLELASGAAIADTGALTVATGATLKINNDETIGALAGAGSVELGSSTLTVGGSESTVFSGVISGSGELVKTGSGTLTLSGANSYTGKTTISAGELIANRVDALSSCVQVYIDGGKLTLASDTTIGALIGGSTGSSVDLGGHTLTLAANSETTLFSGSIGGSGNLVKTGSMTAMLNGNNGYTGTTTVSAGTLIIEGDRNLGAGKVTLAGNATLNVRGTTTIDNAIVLQGDTTTIATDSGAVATLSETVDGPTLTKTGAGTLILVGINKQINFTQVTGGTLQIDTALFGAVSATTGTTVGGHGSVFASLTIESGATLAPGAAGGGVGKLTLNGALALDGTLAVELAGDSSYDSIVTNGVTYGADSAINATRLGNYAPTGATTFRLIDNKGTTSGAFKGVAQGASLAYGDDDYTVSYTASGNAGGSASLTLTSLPRPAVSGVSSSAGDGLHKIDDVITISVAFDRAVNVTGTPTLTLETGTTDRVARYASGSGSSTLTFTYTVEAGDSAADLDYASTGALALAGGTIVDASTGKPAALTLAAPGATYSLGANNAIVIDGNAPTARIALSDSSLTIGETATVTITFSEAVSGFTLADLTVANGTLSGLTSSDGGFTWSATFTPTADVSDTSNVITLANTGVIDAAGNTGAGATSSANYAVDMQRPSATIVVADSVLAAGETSLVTITFSEAVSGFTNADLEVATGTLSAVSSTDGGVTWTAMLTPTAGIKAASNLISLNNGGVVDLAGNAGSGMSDSNNYAVSTVRPTATIIVAQSALKADDSALVTITFSEAVSGFTNDDLTVANGTLSAVSSSDGGITWSATFTPNVNVADSSNVIRLNTAGVTDLAGSAGSGVSDSNNYAIDSVRPSATIVLADTSLTIGETTSVTITFSEAVSGFDASDLTVANGTLSGLTSSDGGFTWSAIFTPTADVSDTSNVITLANTGVIDAAGNTGRGVSDSINYVVDTLRPSATIVVADSVLAAGETSLVTITFSEAVSSFTNDDLTVANGTLSAVTSSDNITWTAIFTPTANVSDTSNVITLANAGVTDVAGNAGAGVTSSNNYAVSTVRPSATIVVADTALKAGATSQVTITFSEAVSGFTNDDLAVANGTLSAVSSNDGGISWSATLTPTADVTDSSNAITLNTAGVASAAGSAGTGVTHSNNYAIDTLCPTATIVLSDRSLTIGETSLVTITFSEAVSGFANDDLAVANGTLSAVISADGGISWSAIFTPTADVSDTSNVITLANTGVTDAAGNTGRGTQASANYSVITARTVAYSATTLVEAGGLGQGFEGRGVRGVAGLGELGPGHGVEGLGPAPGQGVGRGLDILAHQAHSQAGLQGLGQPLGGAQCFQGGLGQGAIGFRLGDDKYLFHEISPAAG